MNAWLNETLRMYLHFFARETVAETYTVIALCVLLGGLVLSQVSTSLGAVRAFYCRGVCITGGGLCLLLAALPLPEVLGLTGWWMPATAAALALLLLVLPLTVLFQKGRYVSALIAWTVTLLTVGAILTVEPMIRGKIDSYILRAAAHRSKINGEL